MMSRTLAVLALTALAAAGALRIEPAVDFVDTVPEHTGLEPYRDLLAELDGTRFVALYMPHAAGPDFRTDIGFDHLVQAQAGLQQHLADRHEISHFLSVHEAVRGAHHLFWVVATSGNPPPDSHSVPDEPVYSQIRDRARDASGDVLATDGSSALVLAFLPDAPQAQLRDTAAAIVADARAWDRPAEVGPVEGTGLLVTSHATDARTASDLAFWGTVSTLAVAAVLVLLLGPAAAATAALCLIVAMLWTFGLLGWLDVQVSFLTVFLAPLVAGIGIDHAIHLLTARRRGVQDAVRSLRWPMALSTATTAAVLLLLALVDAPLFAQVGLVGALGIAMGLAAALVIVPLLPAAARPPHGPHAPRGPGGRLGRAVARAAHAAQRNRYPVAIAVTALVVGAGFAASQLRIESGSAENEFPQDDPHIVLQHRIQSEYGAFERAYLVFQGDIAHPRVLAAMEGAVNQARDLPLHRSATSVVDLLRAQAATDEGVLDIVGIGSDGTPKTPQEARYALHRLFDDPFWGTLAPFVVSRDLDLAVVAVQLDPWETQGDMLALRDALEALAATTQDLSGPSVTVSAAGAPVNRAAVVDHIIPDVAWVAGGGIVIVTSILALAWVPTRGAAGLRAACIGGLIVSVGTLLLLAAVWLLDAYYTATGATHNASLSHMFLLAFAILVGLGVDDHVHVMHAAWRSGDGWSDAGRAVTVTTLTALAAFAPLAGSYFLQSKNLAILVCVAVVLAWLLTIALSPWAHRTRTRSSTSKTVA